MSDVIGIVNYGVAGNIHSIKKAVEKAGGQVLVLNEVNDFSKVDKLILPGVGSFKDAMQELEKGGFISPLEEVMHSLPTLGICLGMQILALLGFEYGKTKGLGVVHAEVKPMLVDAAVPHMGFNSIDVIKPNQLLKGLDNEQFYFMHSYEMVNYTDISALTEYAEHQFVSAIHMGHIFGVQFHPEKSREAGIALFENFVGL